MVFKPGSIVVCKYLLFLVLSLPLSGVPAFSADGVRRNAWSANEDMLLFYEAVTKIRSHVLVPDSPQQIVQKSLQAYLNTLDPFSDYLAPEEYAEYKRSQSSSYSGVGMDISLDRDKSVVCIPYPGGPAETAGIKYGDKLLAINGDTVHGRRIWTLGAEIRGAVGDGVVLTIETNTGSSRDVLIIRRPVEFESVLITRTDPQPVIKILRFTTKTSHELKEAIVKVGTGRAKNIDLRGNIGGDLFGAVDAAGLFLKPGARIVTIQKRDETKRYSAALEPADPSSRIFLWQDRQTASAAEVFISALTQNRRATSLGTTTWGKGVSQKIVELTDGSALILTDGKILPPNELSFHNKGLPPDHIVAGHAGDSVDGFLKKAEELASR